MLTLYLGSIRIYAVGQCFTKCAPRIPLDPLPVLRGPVDTFPIALYADYINPYPTAFPYGNGMVLHFYQQQESSTTKTVHKVINKGLKTYV